MYRSVPSFVQCPRVPLPSLTRNSRVQGSASERQRSSCSGRDCLCSVGEMPSGEAETGGPEWRRSATERDSGAGRRSGAEAESRGGATEARASERASRPQRTSAIHPSSTSGADVPTQRTVLFVKVLFTAGNSCAPSGSPAPWHLAIRPP